MALRLAALLPQYGYRASVLTFSIHPECLDLESQPCPIYVLPLQRTYDLRALRASLEFGRFLKAQKIEIVQTFFESSDLWAGFVAKVLSRARVIWSRRDMGILRTRKHEIAYRLMAGIPDAVFAVSEQVRLHCIEVDRIDPDRVRTVYNGLNLSDWDVASRLTRACNAPHVTTVGNIRRVKGHDIFIKAAASIVLRFPQAVFSVAGDVLEPEYFAELQTLIQDLGLSKHFHFTGRAKNLKEHLAGADIFVLPSRSEGFSNALIEAMAASLPIVATSVGGNSEAVIDCVNGLVVAPEDPAALSEAITELLSNPDRAKAMGLAGKALATEKFTTNAMMDRITEVYAGLISRR